ncbi:protein CNPPD1 [Octopus vulgaris]|uniref:Protein CNPPD1 n=1 Tax=Octopus vulgaris TaxID=6645 RepID=A0AA36EZ63_OCTVU|nr:protein CNPPD1 [Octopus vulgaris]
MFSSSPPEESTMRRSPHNYLDCERSAEHIELTEQLCKTLYYGNGASTDYPSLPLTEIAVKFFQDAAPRSLGKVDMFLASSMTKRAPMPPCSVMLGMLYVKRLKERNPEYLMQISSAELFLISMMMASKYLYDEGLNEEVFNEEWAVLGMMETAEMNQLEQHFLAAIDWRLMVKKEEFNLLLYSVEKKIAFHEGLRRGWLSYTDIWTLAQGTCYSDLCKRTGQDLLEIFAASSVAYVAGVLTLLASSLLTVSLTTRLTALISHPAASSLLPNRHLLLPEYCPTNPYEIDEVIFDPTLNMESLYGIEDSLVWKSLISYGNFPKQISLKCKAENVCQLIGASDQSSCISAATSPQVSLNQENESEIWTLQKLLEMTQASAVMNNIQQRKSGESQDRILAEDNIPSEQPQETTLTADDGHLSRLVPHVSISTALLNLAALFSLKSPTPHEFDKEVGHCKHCRSHHHSVSSPKVNASFPRCQKEAAQSMKCSWSQIRSCLRSRKSPENESPLNSDSENSSLLTAFASPPTSCPLTVSPSLLPNYQLNNPVLNIPNSSQSFARLTRDESFSNCSDTDGGTHNRNHVYEKQKESPLAFKVPNFSRSSIRSCSNLVSSSHLRPPGITNLIINSC